LAAAQIPHGHKLRDAAAAFDAIADWSISFRYPAQRINAFHGEVASLVASSPG
jgi:hypothetical protein